MGKILISVKLYRRLEEIANKISEKTGKTVSVDELANLALRHGLENPEIIELSLKELKKGKK